MVLYYKVKVQNEVQVKNRITLILVIGIPTLNVAFPQRLKLRIRTKQCTRYKMHRGAKKVKINVNLKHFNTSRI